MNLLDEDGYPTSETLERISNWDHNDSQGWFKFIEGIWHHAVFGWREYQEPDTEYKVYQISTCGWSGNESIITAMEDNYILWSLWWYSSTRGGHYLFKNRDD
jgi:hypothetical protein